MIDVTLVGPHTQDGVRYQKGQTIKMTEADAEWYKTTVVNQRLVAMDNPIVRAFAEPAIPADYTANPGVETELSSDRRGQLEILSGPDAPAQAHSSMQGDAFAAQRTQEEARRAELRLATQTGSSTGPAEIEQ